MKPKEVNQPPRKKISQEDFLINCCFMAALSLELMLRDVEQRLNMQGSTFKREKRQTFSRFLDYTKKALYQAEQLTQDIFDVDADNKWKNIPVWQEESNELARLILLYADRSADMDNVFKVFKTLRDIEGEGIVDEKMLDNYYLKKFD